MLIAKLTVSLKDCNIEYNKSSELETTKERGTVLANGKVVRGLGTHFASLEAKVRFDRLTARGNEIRSEFNRRFLRGPFDSTFVVNAGEGKEFARKFETDKPDIVVSLSEYDISGNPDEKEMAEYCARLKAQFKQVPLGRGQEADDAGLSALEALATCPVLTKETRDQIMLMVSEVRVGKMTRTDLKRGISLLEVEMDQTSLAPRRVAVPVG